MSASDESIDLGDRRLRVRRLTPHKSDGLDRTTLVFLHEGLGCIEMWRDFPQALCDATACNGIVYDRTGYGQSSKWPVDPGQRYMEIEADEVLPRLLAALAIEDCVLVGHSDGGTIALNYAAADPEPLRAVVTIAAHAINEAICVAAIHRAREAFAAGDLRLDGGAEQSEALGIETEGGGVGGGEREGHCGVSLILGEPSRFRAWRQKPAWWQTKSTPGGWRASRRRAACRRPGSGG